MTITPLQQFDFPHTIEKHNKNGRWHCCQRPLRLILDVPCYKSNSFRHPASGSATSPEGSVASPRYDPFLSGDAFRPSTSSGLQAAHDALGSHQPPQSHLSFLRTSCLSIWYRSSRQFPHPFPLLVCFASGRCLPDDFKLSSKPESGKRNIATYPQAGRFVVGKMAHNI